MPEEKPEVADETIALNKTVVRTSSVLERRRAIRNKGAGLKTTGIKTVI